MNHGVKRRAICLGLTAVFGFAVPAAAENPPVTLKLERATLRECAAALTQQSGWYIAPPEGAALPGPELRADFDWRDAPLSRCLREMGARYGCSAAAVPWSRSYQLTRRPESATRGPSHAIFEKDGIQVSAAEVRRWATAREDRRREGGNHHSSMYSSLGLTVRLPDQDGELIAGIGDLSITDESGRTTRVTAGETLAGVSTTSTPDAATVYVALASLPSGAKRLARVEGEIYLYPSVTARRVLVPLPLTAPVVRALTPDHTVVVSRAAPEPGPAEAGFLRHGLRLRTYVRQRNDEDASGGGLYMVALLVGRSGRRYQFQSGGGGGVPSAQDWQCTDVHLRSQGVSEPITHLEWSWVERPKPAPRLRFQLSDLPLPNAVTSPLPLAPSPQEEVPELPNAGENPYVVPGGGVLVSPVEPGLGAARPARLRIGLAAARGQDWADTEWLDLPIGVQKSVSLPPLRPGRYRVVRVAVYPPVGTPRGPEPSEGRWLNGIVVVEVKAGGAAVLPPLRWVRGGTEK